MVGTILELRDYLTGEFSMVLSAPLIFFTAWAITAFATFYVTHRRFEGRIRQLEEHIALLSERLSVVEAERNDLRDKLKDIGTAANARDLENPLPDVKALAQRLELIEAEFRKDRDAPPPQDEVGDNANGSYQRYHDGTLVCRGRVPEGNSGHITFPAAFSGSPAVFVYPSDAWALDQVNNLGFSLRLGSKPTPNGEWSAVGRWR